MIGDAQSLRLDPVVPLPWLAVASAVGLLLVAAASWRGRRRPGPAVERGGGVVRTLLVLGIAAILAHPLIEGRATTTAGDIPARQVLVVLDRTTSMAARDWGGERERIAGARSDLAALAAALPGSRLGLVTWGRAAAEVLPFTSDAAAFTQAVELTEPESPSAGTGSSLDRPLPVVREVLERAEEQFPERGAVLLLLSDGEDTSGEAPVSWGDLGDLVDGGAVLGYGTREGATMPRSPSSSSASSDGGPLVIDQETGLPAVSRLEPDNLRRVADDLDLPVLARTEPGGLAAWAATLPEPEAEVERSAPAPYDPTWLLAAVVLALALLELRRWWRDLHAVRRAGSPRSRSRARRAPAAAAGDRTAA